MKPFTTKTIANNESYEAAKATAALLLLVCTFQAAVAQERIWYAGIHLSTGYYQLYNKNDWNADPLLIYPVKSEPTNRTVGATTTYIWSKHFGAGSGLLYSKYKQAFRAAKDPDNPDLQDYYSITDEFHYLKLPLTLEFSTNNKARHQLVASAGLQTSFLMDYREHFLQKSSGFYSEAEWHNKILKHISQNTPDEPYSAFLYNRFLMGLTGTFGYRLKFNGNWLLEIGLKGDYDLSNTENRRSKHIGNNAYFWSDGLKRYGYGGPIENRPKTHNRALGLFINVSLPVAIR